MSNGEKTGNAASVSVKKQPSVRSEPVNKAGEADQIAAEAQPATCRKMRCIEAGEKAGEFLQKILKVKDVKIIRVAKAGSCWEIEAEVYEENSFVKSLGLSTKMQDRNYYSVTLDENLEAQSYERGAKSESKGK